MIDEFIVVAVFTLKLRTHDKAVVRGEGFEPSNWNHVAILYLEMNCNYHGYQTVPLLVLFYPVYPLHSTRD